MAKRFNEDPASTAALGEVVDIYRRADADGESNEDPLSGADVVDELGLWMERNRKLLRKLGIVGDDLDAAS